MKIYLNANQTARAWFGALPEARYPDDDWVKAEVGLSNVGFRQNRVAIELAVHIGPMIEYALLGCEFEPGASDSPVIAVAASPSSLTSPFPDNLVQISDDVRVGLPSEYLNGILEGASIGIEERGGMPNGVLRFGVAAHGAVGSSHMVFSRSAHIAVMLMDMQSGASEAVVAECIEKGIKTTRARYSRYSRYSRY